MDYKEPKEPCICEYQPFLPKDWEHKWPLALPGQHAKDAQWLSLRNTPIQTAGCCFALFEEEEKERNSGWFLGLFRTPESLDRAATMLSRYEEQDIEAVQPKRRSVRVPIFVSKCEPVTQSDKYWDWAFWLVAQDKSTPECLLWVESFPMSWGRPANTTCHMCAKESFLPCIPLRQGRGDPWLQETALNPNIMPTPNDISAQDGLQNVWYEAIRVPVAWDTFCAHGINVGPSI